MIYLAHDPNSSRNSYCLFTTRKDGFSEVALIGNWHKNPPVSSDICNGTLDHLNAYYEHNDYSITEFNNIDDYLQWRESVPELLI